MECGGKICASFHVSYSHKREKEIKERCLAIKRVATLCLAAYSEKKMTVQKQKMRMLEENIVSPTETLFLLTQPFLLVSWKKKGTISRRRLFIVVFDD